MLRLIVIFVILGNSFCIEEEYVTIPLVKRQSLRRLLMAAGADLDKYISHYSVQSINNNEIGDPYNDSMFTNNFSKYENSLDEGPRINDTVAIYKHFDNEYYGIVRVGNPSREFRVILDTAWGNTWIVSKQCPITHIGCLGANKYNSDRSSTYHPDGKTFTIGSTTFGTLSGFFSIDDFYIGHIRVNQTTFGEAIQVPWSYFFSKGDGVVGLGYERLSIGDGLPIFYEIINQRLIKNPVFSFYINSDPSTEHAGVLVFGDSGTKHINGSFTYLPVTRKAYWQFEMQKVYITFGGNRTFTFCKAGCQAIADTSTKIITGPPAEIDKINQLLSATKLIFGRYEVNCGWIRKMPRMSFQLADKNFTIHGEDLVEEMSWRGFKVCLSVFTHSGFTGEDANIWALGGAFLSRYYTTFDLGKDRVGFANLR